LYPVGRPERCLWFRAICILSADWTEDLSCATPGCPGSAAGGSGGSGGVGAGGGRSGGDGGAGGCADALPLGCGDQLSHSTLIQGRPNQWSGYSCTQRLESGPEVLYAFRPNVSSEATVRLTALAADLDVFLLDACDSWACTTVGKSITFRAEAGQTYSLAVDGYNGASGSYTITADCVE
jgi:hypothetical protein